MSKKRGILNRIFKPAWDTVLKQVINLLFLFMGKRIREYKTVILNVLTMVLGAVAILAQTETFDFICNLGGKPFCGGEDSLFFGYILAFVGVINMIVSKVQNDEIIESPAAFRYSKSPLRTWSIIGLIVGVILIISLFFIK